MRHSYSRLKAACYTTNISQAIVANLSPILFLTFHKLYGVSYSLLGLLVLVNFLLQLTIDLIFSFFSHRFNIPKTVTITPLLTIAGLLIYALVPLFFPGAAYAGLVIGTLLFSASGGLAEVLISPVVAAIPAPDPDREMSRLHSMYAWGVVFVIVSGTLFLLAAGTEHWHWLPLLLALVPLTAFLLYLGTALPPMETPARASNALAFCKDRKLWLFFLGGASELTMAQWSSSFLEQALGIPKLWGDLFGVALFSVMLGTGRLLYARFGRSITRIMLLGCIGAAACYFTVAVCGTPAAGILACALTGLCVSMLWPGSLIVASERFPHGGVFIYAMMAAGGDMGSSVGPQLIGIITDAVIANPAAFTLALKLGLAPEQLGMKLGMLVGMAFPLAAIPLFLHIHRQTRRQLT